MNTRPRGLHGPSRTSARWSYVPGRRRSERCWCPALCNSPVAPCPCGKRMSWLHGVASASQCTTPTELKACCGGIVMMRNGTREEKEAFGEGESMRTRETVCGRASLQTLKDCEIIVVRWLSEGLRQKDPLKATPRMEAPCAPSICIRRSIRSLLESPPGLAKAVWQQTSVVQVWTRPRYDITCKALQDRHRRG